MVLGLLLLAIGHRRLRLGGRSRRALAAAVVAVAMCVFLGAAFTIGPSPGI